MIDSQVIGDYLASLASKRGTPGGGAAAGLSGAQACALMSMVCRLTKESEPRIKEITGAADAARAEFMSLADQDMEVFDAVMAAWKLPATDREAALQQALEAAARVPMAMIDEAVAMAPRVLELVDIGNPNLITDTGIAARLLEATISASRLNVLINTRAIENNAFVSEANGVIEQGQAAIAILAQVHAGVDRLLN